MIFKKLKNKLIKTVYYIDIHVDVINILKIKAKEEKAQKSGQ